MSSPLLPLLQRLFPSLSSAPYEISADCRAFVQAESRCNSIKGCSGGCNEASIWLLVVAAKHLFLGCGENKKKIKKRYILMNSLSRERQRVRERVSGDCGSHHLSWVPPPTSLSSSAGDSRLKGCGALLCLCVCVSETERERDGEWVGGSLLTEKKSERQEKENEEEMLSGCRLQPLLFGVWMLIGDKNTDILILWRLSARGALLSLSSPEWPKFEKYML